MGAVGAVPEDYSQWLRCVDFGFTTDDIPPNSEIVGIEVQIERQAENASAIEDYELYLRKTSGQVGDNKADTGTYWPTSDATATYGGAADDWNASLVASDIRNDDFGVDLCVYNGVPFTTYEARVDHVQVRIHYCAYSEDYVESLDDTYHESLSSYTAPTTDSNRLLVFGFAWEEIGGTMTPTGVTFGGESMTELINEDHSYGGNSTGIGIFYLKEADIPSGSQNFVITWASGSPDEVFVAAATFGGVHQTNTIVDSDFATADTTDPIETTVDVVEYGCTFAVAANGDIGSFIWGNDWSEESDQSGSYFTFSAAEHFQEADGTDTASADYQGTPYRNLVGAISVRPKD